MTSQTKDSLRVHQLGLGPKVALLVRCVGGGWGGGGVGGGAVQFRQVFRPSDAQERDTRCLLTLSYTGRLRPCSPPFSVFAGGMSVQDTKQELSQAHTVTRRHTDS